MQQPNAHIRIVYDTYKKLLSRKKVGESMNAVISRLLETSEK